MTYRGQIQHGVVVLENPGVLPEGTKVHIQVVDESAPISVDPLANLIGKATDLPADASRNKRHYLYGQAKSE